ncbi:unknown [Prevotella sp. CAG:1320]|nr:unknown [Prevotella sp. CAG:1320]
MGQTVTAGNHGGPHTCHSQGVRRALGQRLFLVPLIPTRLERGFIAACVKMEIKGLPLFVRGGQPQVFLVSPRQVAFAERTRRGRGGNDKLATREIQLYLLHAQHDGQANNRGKQGADAVTDGIPCLDVNDKERNVRPSHVTYAQRIGHGVTSLLRADATHRHRDIQRPQAIITHLPGRDDVNARPGVEDQRACFPVEPAVHRDEMPFRSLVLGNVHRVMCLHRDAIGARGMQRLAYRGVVGKHPVLPGQRKKALGLRAVHALRLQLVIKILHQVRGLGITIKAGQVHPQQRGHAQRVVA